MVVEIMLVIVTCYLFCGLLFAIPFIIAGLKHVDEAAHGSGIGFRLIIIPGVMVFWPFLLRKWINAK